jgi:hypothetical protein
MDPGRRHPGHARLRVPEGGSPDTVGHRTQGEAAERRVTALTGCYGAIRTKFRLVSLLLDPS